VIGCDIEELRVKACPVRCEDLSSAKAGMFRDKCFYHRLLLEIVSNNCREESCRDDRGLDWLPC